MTLTLRPGVCLTDTGDGAVLLDEDSGRYWTLNATGALVAAQLLNGASHQQAARGLLEHFPRLGAEQALGDVDALLTALREAGLVAG